MAASSRTFQWRYRGRSSFCDSSGTSIANRTSCSNFEDPQTVLSSKTYDIGLCMANTGRKRFPRREGYARAQVPARFTCTNQHLPYPVGIFSQTDTQSNAPLRTGRDRCS
jgi:hypothetical protein